MPTARSLPSRFTRAACAAAFAGLLVAAPSAHAGFHYATLTSQRIFDACVERGINIGLCHDHANFIDPPVDGVTSFHFELAYDTSKYAFDPSKSGPIGAFAVGSDVGPGPGVGTMPLDLLPAGGFNMGTPLPGSTYSVTDIGGVVTVDMTFATPVTMGSDGNVLLLDFRYLQPKLVDLSRSYVTYDPVNPGLDFTTQGMSCSTSSGANACGSNSPTTGVTITTIPEPGTLGMALAGAGIVLLRGRAVRRAARRGAGG